MKRTLMAVALAALATYAGAAGVQCNFDASGLTTLNIGSMCNGYKLWKTGPNSFTVVCPESTPPSGAVELREYFDFNVFGGAKH